MGMSDFYGDGEGHESIATIHRAIELDVSFLDTADIYGLGQNEELVGKAIKNGRERGRPCDEVWQYPGGRWHFVEVQWKA